MKFVHLQCYSYFVRVQCTVYRVFKLLCHELLVVFSSLAAMLCLVFIFQVHRIMAGFLM